MATALTCGVDGPEPMECSVIFLLCSSSDCLQVLKEKGYDGLVVQTGSGSYLPPPGTKDFHLECYNYKSSLHDDLQSASLVISHGGELHSLLCSCTNSSLSSCLFVQCFTLNTTRMCAWPTGCLILDCMSCSNGYTYMLEHTVVGLRAGRPI